MNEQQISRLQGLVGQHFVYDGSRLLVHEMLADQNTLVLMFPDRERMIQNNQYGEPLRRVPELISISFDEDEAGLLHPIIQFLLEQ